MSVPFPFGLEDGCSGREAFQLKCEDVASSAAVLDAYNNVTLINIDEGTIDIRHMAQDDEQRQFMALPGAMADLYETPPEYPIRSMQWVVANLTCSEAQHNSSAYACVSDNSICIGVHSSNGYLGYRCKCLAGLDGNPYIQYGCKGNYPQPIFHHHPEAQGGL